MYACRSTRPFTNRRFPHELSPLDGLPPAVRRRAERVCRRLGIRKPQILVACILDVALTGDNRFATSSRQLERRAGRFGRVTGGATTGTTAITRWTLVSAGGRAVMRENPV